MQTTISSKYQVVIPKPVNVIGTVGFAAVLMMNSGLRSFG